MNETAVKHKPRRIEVIESSSDSRLEYIINSIDEISQPNMPLKQDDFYYTFMAFIYRIMQEDDVPLTEVKPWTIEFGKEASAELLKRCRESKPS